jgi:hypothetical protein
MDMPSREQILTLIKKGECDNLEFKQRTFLENTNDVAKTISAIANCKGGILLVGVTDKGEIEGMEYNKQDEEKIMQISSSKCNPPVILEFIPINFDEGTVYHINILKTSKPVKANDRFFIRHGSITRTMELDEIKYFRSSETKIDPDIPEEMDIITIFNHENSKNIIIESGKEIPYIELRVKKDSAECIIYAKNYNRFYDKCFNLNAFFPSITIDDLRKLLNVFYATFPYDHYVSAFGINQGKYSWFGYGPSNFIAALESQDYRYIKLRANNEYIHHRELACFIDEIMEGVTFYIQLQPNRKDGHNDLITMDYVNVGFFFDNIPYDRVFYEFFKKINYIPCFINEFNKDLTFHKDLNSSFKEKGFIVNSLTSDKWVCGVIGENSRNLQIGNAYCDKIVVNFNQFHLIDNSYKYKVTKVMSTSLPLDSFQVLIINYAGDWEKL